VSNIFTKSLHSIQSQSNLCFKDFYLATTFLKLALSYSANSETSTYLLTTSLWLAFQFSKDKVRISIK